jgi:hypothetical protein
LAVRVDRRERMCHPIAMAKRIRGANEGRAAAPSGWLGHAVAAERRGGLRQISFRLPYDAEADWPPVRFEWVNVAGTSDEVVVGNAPIFIKDLSKGDTIRVAYDAEDEVAEWSHVSRSSHSTVWVMCFGGYDLSPIKAALLALECDVVQVRGLEYFVIDVPPAADIAEVMGLLDEPEADGRIAVAYPSLRHPAGSAA